MAIFWSDLSWMTMQFSVLLSLWNSGYTSLMSSMGISWQRKSVSVQTVSCLTSPLVWGSIPLSHPCPSFHKHGFQQCHLKVAIIAVITVQITPPPPPPPLLPTQPLVSLSTSMKNKHQGTLYTKTVVPTETLPAVWPQRWMAATHPVQWPASKHWPTDDSCRHSQRLSEMQGLWLQSALLVYCPGNEPADRLVSSTVASAYRPDGR